MISKIFKSQEEITDSLKIIAEQINLDYRGQDLVLIYSAAGASVFLIDLVRLIKIQLKVMQICYKAYVPPAANGEVQILLDVSESIEGKHVLFLDGIIVSGRTPLFIVNLLRQRNPLSINLCVVGSKSGQIATNLPVKYKLFDLQNEWIEGYGIGSGANKFSSSLLSLS